MHLIAQTKKYVIIKLDMRAICSYVPTMLTPYIPICKFITTKFLIYFLSCKRDLFDIIGLFFLTGFFAAAYHTSILLKYKRHR